jgi:hypothetical protein
VAYQVSETRKHAELTRALDSVRVPTDYKLVDEYWIGNSICLDECLELYRRYSSPSAKLATFHLVASVLTQAGYRCVSHCDGFDAAGDSLLTTWQQAGEPTISMLVFSAAEPETAGVALHEPLDQTRPVHVDLQT